MESREARLSFRIIGGEIHKHANPPHAFVLRPRRERPRGRRAAECGQQFPPSDGDCHTPLPCEVRKGTVPRHERDRLSIAMWRVMAVLASKGSQRQIDLADLTSIDASTLSRIVTRLVRMGLLARTRSTSSNREVAVTLSRLRHLVLAAEPAFPRRIARQ